MPANSLFLPNKYTRWYFAIIKNAQVRTITGYVEKHHIIPKSLGGENCGKTTTKGNYKRWHSDNCKVVKGELKFRA